MAKEKAKRRGRPQKQRVLFDTNHPAHDDIVKGLEALYEARSQRLQWGQDETAEQDKLLVILKEHKLKVVDLEGYHAEIVVEKEKIKVKKMAESEPEPE